ncbi:hypothetical protein NQ318_006994 [Aromia moschata]|uniref:Uncharacterized protein n=1 Tax=Aromia moschata TaxID=1265417 RepID=A0AAV8X4E0_9CUCU|nr:hypothetical protein NQ318_006994 [Aromia moschata]
MRHSSGPSTFLVRDEYISNLMTLNRFSSLLSHIHLNDNAVMPAKGQNDKPVIEMILSIHDPTEYSQVKRREKDGSLTEVQCPVAVKEYRSCMGSVDRADTYAQVSLLVLLELQKKALQNWYKPYVAPELCRSNALHMPTFLIVAQVDALCAVQLPSPITQNGHVLFVV